MKCIVIKNVNFKIAYLVTLGTIGYIKLNNLSIQWMELGFKEG